MTDISTAVETAMANLVGSGRIEKAIEETLARTISDCIDQHMRSYSEFGKAISEKVKAAIGADLGRISLPEYHAIVLELVSRKLHEFIKDQGTKQFEEMLGELLEPAPPEIKLSQIVTDFKDWVADRYDYEDRSDSEITVILEEPEYSFSTTRWVYLDKDANKRKYDCEFAFLIAADGRVSAIRCKGKNAKEDLFLGGYYGFERTLFKLHVGATTVIVDTYDTCMPDSAPA